MDGLEFDERSSVNDYPTEASRTVFVHAHKVTWTRSARRQLKKASTGVGTNELTLSSVLPPSVSSSALIQSVLSCSIDLIVPGQGVSDSSHNSSPTPVSNNQSDSNPEPRLVFQWIYGTEHSIFFGFAQHVGRKVAAALSPSGTASKS